MRKHEELYLPHGMRTKHSSSFCPCLDLNMGFAFTFKSDALTCCTQADNTTDDVLAGPWGLSNNGSGGMWAEPSGTHSVRKFPTAFKNAHIYSSMWGIHDLTLSSEEWDFNRAFLILKDWFFQLPPISWASQWVVSPQWWKVIMG